jgi:hypothetical protein
MPNKKVPADHVREATAALFDELATRNTALARLMRADVVLEARTVANLFVEADKYQKKLALFEARLTDR